MKLNAFSDVCLRTLMLLGSRRDDLVTTRDISEQIGVPYNQVAKAVITLRNLQAIDVSRGRYGGSKISAHGLQLTVGGLLRELDDRDDVVDCVSADGVECPLLPHCALRGALRRAREAFYAELDNMRIGELSTTQTSRMLPVPILR